MVKRRTKGGLIVDIYGVEAFLPGSQIDVKPIRDFDVFVDKKMEVKALLDVERWKSRKKSEATLLRECLVFSV